MSKPTQILLTKGAATTATPGNALGLLLTPPRAASRYRVYLFDVLRAGGDGKTEVARDLTWLEATAMRDELTATLKTAGMTGIGDPQYGLELTNEWELMSDAARRRARMQGLGPSDFNC